ncbi:Wzz/FepE/Etk N-terminal domain-containing protein [Gottfriedia acidiceleris]|uniref:YveK family protein n=1 Tax=Gottfriedia acidiceleris TaxID=371036 RepID=UPI002FFF3093
MENEFNIKKLYGIIKKRFWILLVSIGLFTSLGGIYTYYFTMPQYSTSSKLIVNAKTPELMNTLLVMVKEPSLLRKVINQMNLNTTPDELSKEITAESINGSSVVQITAVDLDPKLAAEIANTTANVFMNQMPGLLGFKDIKFLSYAEVNTVPTNDSYSSYIIYGFLVGIVLGIALIFLLDSLDDTVRSEQSVEDLLGIPFFGTISKMNKKNTSLSKIESKLNMKGDYRAAKEHKIIKQNRQNQSSNF